MLLPALRLAHDVRQCLRVTRSDNAEALSAWCASSEIVSRVEEYLIASEARSGQRHPSLIRSCLASEARILGLALHGDDSSLWALLLVMVSHARMGSPFVAIAGPVGSGKTLTIVAATTVLSLVSTARVAMIMDSNDPIDDMMDLAWRVLSESVQLIRLTSHAQLSNLRSKAPRSWAAAIVPSNGRVELDESRSSLLCSTLDLCMKRLGGYALIPSNAFVAELVYVSIILLFYTMPWRGAI